MTIQDQIEADLKDAMKAKQAERLSVLRMAKSALMNATIEKYGAGGKLSDPEAVVVIRKQVKQREDSIAGFEKGGRPELADKERREMEIRDKSFGSGSDQGSQCHIKGAAWSGHEDCH